MSCDSSACIHVTAVTDGTIHIWADSDEDDYRYARVTRAEWAAFVAAVKAGEFDNLENQDA